MTLDDAGLPEDAEAVLEETGMTEGISGVLAPITILAAVVMALLEYFGKCAKKLQKRTFPDFSPQQKNRRPP